MPAAHNHETWPSETPAAEPAVTMNSKSQRMTWTSNDNVKMLGVLRECKLAGDQSDNGWKKKVWTVVAHALKDSPGGMKNSQKCMDHWGNLKSNFVAMQKLSSLSGFGWDDNLKMVTALPAVWDELRNKSHMKKYLRWEHTPFPSYDKMLFLIDGIVATGSAAFHAGSHPIANDFASLPPADNIHDTDDEGHNISITSPPISEAMLHHRLIHTPMESPRKPAKRICAPTESPLKSAKRVCGSRNQSSAQAVAQVADAIRFVADTSHGGPATPERRKIAVCVLDEDDDLSDCDYINAVKLFRHDITIADSYTAISKKSRHTLYILEELAESHKESQGF
ncbi:hypothetical protein BU15DRAFT_80855 [Melanogaster broomeanus]|nr:hypothetical protein BU15DRAFT_80855 [Melanogaster broomeanus]